MKANLISFHLTETSSVLSHLKYDFYQLSQYRY